MAARKRCFGCSATDPGIGSGFGLWCYRQVPGFAAATRYGYRFVAGHRSLASALTKALWGKRRGCCLPPYLLQCAYLVSSAARIGLLNRILVLLEPGRRIDRSRRNSAGGALAGRTAESVRDGSVPIIPDALLVQSRRFVPAFSVCSRSRTESSAYSADRATFLSDSVVGPLSFAQRGGAGLYELSMGLPASGSRFSQHLPGAIPTLSIATLSKSHLPLGAFSPPLAPVPTHVHVGGGEADQWRRFLVEPNRAPVIITRLNHCQRRSLGGQINFLPGFRRSQRS